MKAKMLAVIAALALAAAFLPAAQANRPRSQPAEAPWPMFRHDALHTGRSPYLGPMSPVLKWRYATGGPITSSPAISAGGMIYVGSHDGYIYAINRSGGPGWRFATGAAVESSPAIGSDGTVYVGSNDCHLYAINPNGTLQWRYATVGRVRSSPVIAADGTIYVASDAIIGVNPDGTPILGADDPYLYAINPDGTLKWRRDISRMPPRLEAYSSPAIGPDGTVYVGTPTGELMAFNPDGSTKWECWMVSAHVNSSPAVAADGYLWVGCEVKGVVFGITPDGSLDIFVPLPYDSDVTSSPAIAADGTVYFGVDAPEYGYPFIEGYLAAVDPANMGPWDDLKWSYVADGAVDSSPAIGADGTVYFGSLDGYIYAVTADGHLRWRYRTGGGVYSSPAIGPDCTLYVGSNDGYLYAIQNGVTLQNGVDSYTGSEDTYIHQYSPNRSYCSENQFQVGYKQQHAALLHFDLSEIPVDARVVDASLELYATGWSGSRMNIDAFAIRRETELCEATWSEAHSGAPWAEAGCNGAADRSTRPFDWIIATGPRRWYRLDMTNLVGGWVQDPSTNRGILLREESTSTSLFYFASAQNEAAQLRPKLVVVYTVSSAPAPTPTPTETPTPTPLPPEGTVTLQYGTDGYTGSEDTYIYQYAPETNYHTQHLLEVGYKQQHAVLMRFDLSSAIPSGATVTRAGLEIYAAGWSGSELTIDAFRVLRGYSFSEATWKEAWTGFAWVVPGCNDTVADRSGVPESSVTARGPRHWYEFDLTNLVQAWADGSQDNFGVLLRAASASTGLFYLASNEGDVVEQRPRLVVSYR
jgi:outer membrane protein assembly factor BamB